MTTENLTQKIAGMRSPSRFDRVQLRELFQAIRTAFLAGSATYDAANLVDAAGATTTVTVTGAALGDYVLVSHGVDLQGITVTGWVSAANTVSVRFQNESGGALDLASATLRVLVLKRASFDGTYFAGLRV
jgi:hypothetical protein